MIDLKEIIWEITTECHNNCDYCGSCDVTETPGLSNDELIKITHTIAKYPPESINISGGDPTLIDQLVHKDIVGIFKKNGVSPKIIVNPLSIPGNETILNMYDSIGVSINDDLEYECWCQNNTLVDKSKITFLSNFNKANLWLFDQFLDLAIKHKAPWQVMLTMFKETDMLAIYESETATNYFVDLVNNAKKKHKQVVLADNITSAPCSAGMHSIGILADGSVIPCLSMRSWHPDIDSQIQGNLLTSEEENPLETIWQNGFKEQRFEDQNSCKEHCNNLNCDLNKEVQMPSIEKIDLKPKPEKIAPWPNIPNIPPYKNPDPAPNIVMVYGVFPNPEYPGLRPIHSGDPIIPGPSTISEIKYDGPSFDELLQKSKKDDDSTT